VAWFITAIPDCWRSVCFFRRILLLEDRIRYQLFCALVRSTASLPGTKAVRLLWQHLFFSSDILSVIAILPAMGLSHNYFRVFAQADLGLQAMVTHAVDRVPRFMVWGHHIYERA